MLCFPNCKINLGLYVTRKRADGYHDLETVFYPVAIHDVLEVVPGSETTLSVTGDHVAGKTADNLVYKAYELLRNRFPGQVPPMSILLHKVIPSGAGLGGGSADGSFMLRLINDFCNLGCSESLLLELALSLGSDCPFFIKNRPVFAGGRGELFEPVSVDLSDYTIQVVVPNVHISTGAAFGMILPATAGFNLRQLGDVPVAQWRNQIQNDFEIPVFQAHPGLASIKNQMYQQGAVYASLSGSGSAIFGLFEKGKSAQITSSYHHRVFVTETGLQ